MAPSGVKFPLEMGMRRNFFPATGNRAEMGGRDVRRDGDEEYAFRP